MLFYSSLTRIKAICSSMESSRSYPWTTAVFCCVLNFLMLGLLKVSGLLFVETQSHFQISRQSASLPYILSVISRSIAGPTAGFVGHTYGLRIVIVTGCIIGTIGIFTCFFATNVWFIYILWGGVVGFGVGLTISLLAQVININFKEDFSKANGISVVGVPLSGLLLSPTVEYFLKTYGLAGTFLILSAIVLHGVPVAMMMKIPSHNRLRRKQSNNQSKTIAGGIISKPGGSIDRSNEDFYSRTALLGGERKTIVDNKIVYLENFSCTKQRKSNDTIIVNINKSSNHDYENVEKEFLNAMSLRDDALNNGLNTNQEMTLVEDCENHTLLSSDQSNLRNELSNTIEERIPLSRHPACLRCPKSLHVFTNVSYLLIAFSNGSIIFLSFVYPTICTDFALDKGMTIIESTYLLMIIGGADIIPRLTLGWVTDRGYLTRANFCALFFFLSTISILWTMWSVNFLTMSMAVSLQSFSIGALFPVIPGIIPKYVENDEQTIAIASAPFFLVPLSVSTPALIGYFRDGLGSYNALMYFFSLISILNCIFLLLLPYIDKWRRMNKKPEEEIEN